MTTCREKRKRLGRAKAGGPVMTVINPEGAVGEVWCTWSVGGRLVKEVFSPVALEKVSG